MLLLREFPPSLHVHIHQNPSCASTKDEGEITAAMKAGGHYDPRNSGAMKG
jgi:superoxide dismutase, Cu-Zn family